MTVNYFVNIHIPHTHTATKTFYYYYYHKVIQSFLEISNIVNIHIMRGVSP